MRPTSSVVWNTLANYESRELLSRSYLAKHSLETSKNPIDVKEICAEISSNIIQARQYFEASAEADRVIRPLLLYYGVLGLSRALILFLNRGKREATLSGGHGLGTHCWSQILSPTGGGISELAVKIHKGGTFRELCDATKNRSLIRFHSSSVEWKIEHAPLPDEILNLKFEDLIVRTPSVATTSRRWLTLPFRFVEVGFLEKTDVGLKVLQIRQHQHKLGKTIEYCDLESILPDHGFDLHDTLPGSFRFDAASVKNCGEAFAVWDDVPLQGAFAGIGTPFFVPKIGNISLCQLCSTFIYAYVLGMLCRYFPSHWTRLVRNERNDAALPTILSALDYVEFRFPQIALDFLEERP